MKIVPNRILCTLVAVVLNASAFAAPVPNEPPQPGLPPPGLPIDSGIATLIMAAVLFGLFKIYQLRLNKKTPM